MGSANILLSTLIVIIFSVSSIAADTNNSNSASTNGDMLWHAFNLDNTFVLTMHNNGNAHVWHVPPKKNNNESIKIGVGEKIISAGWHEDNPHWVIARNDEQETMIWDVSTGKLVRRQEAGIIAKAVNTVKRGTSELIQGSINNFVRLTGFLLSGDDNDHEILTAKNLNVDVVDLSEDTRTAGSNLVETAVSDDERFSVYVYADGSCEMETLSEGNKKRIGNQREHICLAYFSEDNSSHAILVTQSGQESTWDLESGQRIKSAYEKEAEFRANQVSYRPDY